MQVSNKQSPLYSKCNFAFMLLFFASSAASYLERVPAHHRTSYVALLRQARSLRAGLPQGATEGQKQSTTTQGGCQDTCEKIGQLWARNCFSSTTPLCTSMQDAKKHDQLRCVAGCLSVDPSQQERANRPQKVNRRVPSIGSQLQTPGGAEVPVHAPPRVIATFDDAHLTSADKCRMEGLEGSLTCELEYDDPDEAERIFNEVFPHLNKRFEESYADELTSQNNRADGGNLAAEANGASIPLSSARNPASRSKRHILSTSSFPKKKLLERARSKRDARSRDQEVCQTQSRIEQPSRARHFLSGEMVSLYFYRGRNRTGRYAQRFETARCVSSNPIVNVIAGARCKATTVKVLADFLINLNLVDQSQFRACSRAGPGAVLCRDWVVMPTACKLFITNASPANG